MYSQSLFLYKVGLTEVKENDLKDTSIRKLLAKTQNEFTRSSKIANIIFLVKISFFKEGKNGIFKLKMLYPADGSKIRNLDIKGERLYRKCQYTRNN